MKNNMKILYIHNDYAKPSGEETAAEAIVALLKEHGHEVRWFRRSSAEIKGFSGKVKSQCSNTMTRSERLNRGKSKYRCR